MLQRLQWLHCHAAATGWMCRLAVANLPGIGFLPLTAACTCSLPVEQPWLALTADPPCISLCGCVPCLGDRPPKPAGDDRHDGPGPTSHLLNRLVTQRQQQRQQLQRQDGGGKAPRDRTPARSAQAYSQGCQVGVARCCLCHGAGAGADVPRAGLHRRAGCWIPTEVPHLVRVGPSGGACSWPANLYGCTALATYSQGAQCS